MDAYDPATVFSSIDRGGRYAYGNQPRIAHWNLARLAETLLPLLDADETAAIASAQEGLAAFGPRFQSAYLAGLRRKIGLLTEREGDDVLAQDFLALLAADGVDFTLAFRALADAPETKLPGLFADGAALDAWIARWRSRVAAEPGGAHAAYETMRAVNPVYIPRNHLVEAALDAAVSQRDYAPFEALLGVLSRPFESDVALSAYADGPREDQRVLQTFCGT
jgi:uncharacterized protein YdiU (UPF0061 family)